MSLRSRSYSHHSHHNHLTPASSPRQSFSRQSSSRRSLNPQHYPPPNAATAVYDEEEGLGLGLGLGLVHLRHPSLVQSETLLRQYDCPSPNSLHHYSPSSSSVEDDGRIDDASSGTEEELNHSHPTNHSPSSSSLVLSSSPLPRPPSKSVQREIDELNSYAGFASSVTTALASVVSSEDAERQQIRKSTPTRAAAAATIAPSSFEDPTPTD